MDFDFAWSWLVIVIGAVLVIGVGYWYINKDKTPVDNNQIPPVETPVVNNYEGWLLNEKL